MSGCTFPFTVIDLLEPDPARRARARALAVPVGASSEVPFEVLEELRPGLGVRCGQYLEEARDLWDRIASGRPAGDGVIVRVPLLDLRQVDSKTERSDLTAQVQAMERMPQLREHVGVLDAKPRWSKIREGLGGSGSLTRVKDRATLLFTIRSAFWPLELGGPPCPGEVRREFLLEVSHAAWRDRRSRRLMRLAAAAVEVWPDPEPFIPEDVLGEDLLPGDTPVVPTEQG